MSKKTQRQPMVFRLQELTDKHHQATGKDVKNYINTIANFRKFIDEKGIEDDLKVLNLQTMNLYKDWLLESGKAIKTTKDLLRAFKALVEMLNKAEQRTGDKYIDLRAFEMPKGHTWMLGFWLLPWRWIALP